MNTSQPKSYSERFVAEQRLKTRQFILQLKPRFENVLRSKAVKQGDK